MFCHGLVRHSQYGDVTRVCQSDGCRGALVADVPGTVGNYFHYLCWYEATRLGFWLGSSYVTLQGGNHAVNLGFCSVGMTTLLPHRTRVHSFSCKHCWLFSISFSGKFQTHARERFWLVHFLMSRAVMGIPGWFPLIIWVLELDVSQLQWWEEATYWVNLHCHVAHQAYSWWYNHRQWVWGPTFGYMERLLEGLDSFHWIDVGVACDLHPRRKFEKEGAFFLFQPHSCLF